MRIAAYLIPLALLTTPALAEEAHHQTPATTPPAASEAKPAMPMMGMNHGGMMGGGMMMNCPMMKGERVEGRIAFLHTELKITAAQEEAWKGFTEALRADSAAMAEHHGMMQEMMKGGDMPMNAGSRIAMMEHKLASLKAMQAATDKLYTALSDEQKKTADELLGQYR